MTPGFPIGDHHSRVTEFWGNKVELEALFKRSMEHESNSVPRYEEQALSSGNEEILPPFAVVGGGDVTKSKLITSESAADVTSDSSAVDAGTIKELEKLTVTEEPDKSLTLKREVTPFSGVLVVVNQFIGSGIFITQSGILNYAGSFGLSLLCWAFGGVVALAGAMCYLELGLLVRKTGGEYAILLEAYSFRKKNRWVEMLGSLVSFLYTWTNVFLLRGVSVSIITLTCARYFTRPFFIGCDVPEAAVKLLALSILIILVLINIYGMKLLVRVTMIFSTLKLLAIVFIVAVGVISVSIHQCVPDRLHQPFKPLEGHEPSVPSVALALYGVLWSYDAWNIMNYAVEETKNIERTLSVSLMVGVPIVCLCYLTVNTAFFLVLPYEDILGAKAVALPFGEATMGKAGLVVIPILVSFSTFGAANGAIYITSRLIFGAARDHLLPEFLSSLHTKFRTPIPALIMLAVLGSIMISAGSIQELIETYSVASFFFHVLVFIALLIMRVTHANQPRFFKGYFIIPVAVFAIVSSTVVILLPIAKKPTPAVIAVVTTLIGIPVFVFFVMETPWRLRPKILDRISKRLTWHINNVLNTQLSKEATMS